MAGTAEFLELYAFRFRKAHSVFRGVSAAIIRKASLLEVHPDDVAIIFYAIEDNLLAVG